LNKVGDKEGMFPNSWKDLATGRKEAVDWVNLLINSEKLHTKQLQTLMEESPDSLINKWKTRDCGQGDMG